MITLDMYNGDISIEENGQPKVISGIDKLNQDIGEALNSKYNYLKDFGGGLVELNNLDKDQIYSEIYKILNRLMKTQTNAELDEKIKSINKVTVYQTETTCYAYIEVTNCAGEKSSNSYSII